MTKPVILTGIRANNDLQIGNYFGAMLPTADLARKHAGKYQINIFVPDLHSFTTPIDHSQLQTQIMSNLRMFVAAGLPLEDSNVHIYRQSHIPAHSELTWILGCFSGFGELSRMTEFKDKSKRLGSEHIGIGQFVYPVLQASDILLYNALYIPVGEDQRQHIEFCRGIAERMNSKFGELFTVPKAMNKQLAFTGRSEALRIKDLIDPGKKMSKSDESGKGVIFLNDPPEVARKKIIGATTDSFEHINYDPKNQPGMSNLLEIYGLLGGEAKDFIGQTQYGPFKSALAERVADFLGVFQTNLASVDDIKLTKKLEQSEAEMRKVANQTLLRVQKAVGLRP